MVSPASCGICESLTTHLTPTPTQASQNRGGERDRRETREEQTPQEDAHNLPLTLVSWPHVCAHTHPHTHTLAGLSLPISLS